MYCCIIKSIYQSWLERVGLDFGSGGKLRLKFASEAGLQELVCGVRQPWQQARGVQLEVRNNLGTYER